MKMKELWAKAKSRWSSFSGNKSRHPILAILLSVFVALVLWFYVQDAESPNWTQPFSASVVAESLPEDLAVLSGDDVKIEVTLSGKRSDLNRIKDDDLVIKLDLSGITKAGEYNVDVAPEQLKQIPEGTTPVEVNPKMVTVKVGVWSERDDVPVTVSFTGGPASGDAELTATTPNLKTVTVKGPKNILDTIDHAEIDAGDLGEVSGSFERNLEYRLVDANGKEVTDPLLSKPQKTIRVRFALTQKKEVPLVVETVHGYWGTNWSYTISADKILVKGEPDAIANVTQAAALRIDETTVDATRLDQTVTASEIKALLPSGVTLAEEIGTVTVNVTIRDSARRYISIPLSTQPPAPPKTEDGTVLAYDIREQSITLTVRGSNKTINKAAVDAFDLYIDLDPYVVPGEYEVPVEVILDADKEGMFYVVGEYTVHVTISNPET